MSGQLRRENVTAGSQIVLPAYPVLTIALGLLYIWQAPVRMSSDAFEIAKQVMSIPQWGTLFLAIGVAEAACFLVFNATWLRYLLIAGCGLCGFWAVLVLWSAGINPNVSWTSGLWIVFVGWAHIASARSLARDVIFRAPR